MSCPPVVRLYKDCLRKWSNEAKGSGVWKWFSVGPGNPITTGFLIIFKMKFNWFKKFLSLILPYIWLICLNIWIEKKKKNNKYIKKFLCRILKCCDFWRPLWTISEYFSGFLVRKLDRVAPLIKDLPPTNFTTL